MNSVIEIRTNKRIEAVDITNEINKIISDSSFSSGLCIVYSPHTTSGIMINESFDSAVIEDINSFLSKLVPHKDNYLHHEGNSDAHIKSSLIGPSKTLTFGNQKIILGTWQGIFFMEFDGPRSRKVHVKLIKG